MTKFTAGKKYYNKNSGSILYCVGLSSDGAPVFETENQSIFNGSGFQACLDDTLVEYREPRSIFVTHHGVNFQTREEAEAFLRKHIKVGCLEDALKKIVEYKEVL